MKDRYAHLIRALLVAVPLSWFSATLLAQETASLPYRVVYRQLKTLEELEKLDKLFHSVRFESSLEGVAPTDIRISLEDGSQTFAFTPDVNGNVELPLRADWNEADLVLHTNQPKGSLAIRFGFAARPLAGTQLRYRDLMEIRRQFEQALAGLAGSVNAPAPSVKGLEIRFKPAPDAAVVVLGSGGRQVHRADGRGLVRLSEDPALWEENPETVLAQLPEAVGPWME
jgi:hypothetical protein